MTLKSMMQSLADMDPDNRTTEQERLEVAKLLLTALEQRNGIQERAERQPQG